MVSSSILKIIGWKAVDKSEDRKKEGGIAGLFQPTGDIDSDMKIIKEFYANIAGKNTKQFVR